MQKVNKLLQYFVELREIMLMEEENNWIRGIRLIITCLEDVNLTEEEKLKETFKTFSMMNSGNGSFSDFYIWRDDINQRVELNHKLEEVKNNIWDLLQ